MSLLGLIPESWVIFYSYNGQASPVFSTENNLLAFSQYTAAKTFADTSAALALPGAVFMVLPVYYSAESPI